MLKNLAILFGVVFLLVGILGFFPVFTPVHSNGMRYLLGLFEVGGIHNVIHIASGAAALAAGLNSERLSQLWFRVFGVVYAIVTVVGFVQKDTVLGIFHVNTGDNFLHLALAVAILAVGFGIRPAVIGTTTARADDAV